VGELRTTQKITVATELCNACGLCCNGAIFANVKLRLGDDQARLTKSGLPIIAGRGTHRTAGFLQPCVAHDGCKCSIYSSRPVYCRQFECALLKRVNAAKLEKIEALKTINLARALLAKILRALHELGEADDTLSHRIRFKKASAKMQRLEPRHPNAGVFADLTLAVHDLDLVLAESFYPG